MSDIEKNLYYLNELTDYTVADHYADVRGWEVEDIENRIIGKVDNLIVDKNKKLVVYLDVEVNESVIEEGYNPQIRPEHEDVQGFVNKDGDNHIILPIGMVTLDEENEKVRTIGLKHISITAIRRFNRGTHLDPVFESNVLQDYSSIQNYRSGDGI